MRTYTKKSIKIEYTESYLPTPRHRKYHYRTVNETITVRVRTIDRKDARLAFEMDDYGSVSRHQTQILLYAGKLYIRSWRHLTEKERQSGLDGYAVELASEHWFCPPWNANLDREGIIQHYKEHCAELLFVRNDEGILETWERCGEPRYVIMTFGLGHNHGGTALMIDTMYNVNISYKRYFSALQGDLAVAEANRIATARGDTKDVGTFHKMIVTHIPEAVRLNPRKQHGEGDKFMNAIEEITEASGSTLEAGILTMALVAR